MEAARCAGPFSLKNPDDGGEDLYRDFHWGRESQRHRRVRLPPRPRRLVQLGTVESITYAAKKGDTDAYWQHAFGEEGGTKPTLAVDPRSNRLHFVGGDYRVEGRGIVD